MMWKKGIALLWGLMLLATVPTFGRAAAESNAKVTVILVSDNEADGSVVQYLANVTGAVVVTTPWGRYDPNVTARIIAYAPDEVIIIGGPVAVSEEYASDLEELNITVERWGGANRYETNLKVMKEAMARFGLSFNESVIIVPGNDSVALKKAVKIALRKRALLLFVNGTDNVTERIIELHMRPKNVTLIGTPVMERVLLRAREHIREHLNTSVEEVEVNMTAQTALEAINASEERIEAAREMLQNVTLPPSREKLADKMLNLSEMELERAKEAYNEGKYGRAYGQAIAAGAHAEFVIKIASDEWNVQIKANRTRMAEVFVWKVEKQLQVLEKAGINVTELKGLVEQLKTAIANRDYDAIDSLIHRIREKLLEIYTQGRFKLRERIVFPAHRGHGKP
ncbi:hypothetical protein A3L12_07780 [Thermococcus sp. P6]|uniref:hypothetical protein n=1 Tax=Thermococcus sp. P6 TaxID=122420 RepID=UPI000B5A0AF9|nr:hypothetical protein [Thermococcus sp. P6]ASJ11200.1 hypothetical protein A3L12_07780 [Thermococcus sp. P6]